jgi:hypothetical protein
MVSERSLCLYGGIRRACSHHRDTEHTEHGQRKLQTLHKALHNESKEVLVRIQIPKTQVRLHLNEEG